MAARTSLLLAIGMLAVSCAGTTGAPPANQANANASDNGVTTLRVSTIPTSPPPAVVGASAIVIDADSGRVLYAKNADEMRQVASTQKLVTALTVAESGNLSKPVVVDSSDTACEPTKLNIRAGDVYTRGELVKALLVKSGNDLGRALARDVGGSQEGFSEMMNRKARSLGMQRSHFENPHGLPDSRQYSTARDMAIAARAVYHNPVLSNYVSTRSYTFRYGNGQTRVLENTNRLLKRVPYCNGMKTGTTDLAGRCLVCSGSLNGRSAIVVVLKSNSASIWNDSEKLLRWALERPAAQ